MFENAKAYNRPDSNLYKWAVKLQKVMQNKLDELLQDDDEAAGSYFDGTKEFVDLEEKSPPLLEVSNSSRDSWSNKTPQSGKKNLYKKSNTREGTPLGSLKGKELNRVNSTKELLKARFMALYTALLESKVYSFIVLIPFEILTRKFITGSRWSESYLRIYGKAF